MHFCGLYQFIIFLVVWNEMSNFSTIFREMDADEDAEVSFEELEAFLQKEGYPTENMKVSEIK